MDEHGVSKIRYAQPQKTTHFMNRKIAMPKKSAPGVSQNDQAAIAKINVTEDDPENAAAMNADLELEKLQNSAISAGVGGGDKRSQSPKKQPTSLDRRAETMVPQQISQK